MHGNKALCSSSESCLIPRRRCCAKGGMAAIDRNIKIINSTTPPPPPPKFYHRDSFSPREFPKENITSASPQSSAQWPLPSLPLEATNRTYSAPLSTVHVNAPQPAHPRPLARVPSFELGDDLHLRRPARRSTNNELERHVDPAPMVVSDPPPPPTHQIPFRKRVTPEVSELSYQSQPAVVSAMNNEGQDWSRADPKQESPHFRNISGGSRDSRGSLGKISEYMELRHPLPDHHDQLDPGSEGQPAGNNHVRPRFGSTKSGSPPARPRSENAAPSRQHLGLPRDVRPSSNFSRPASAYSINSDHANHFRSRSPHFSPSQNDRTPSVNSGRSPDSRPMSYVDLLNVPYPQPPPAPTNLDNAHLRTAVGKNASLLSTKQTLDMYRANVKKTNDPTIQYEFAIFMINTAQEIASGAHDQSVPRQLSPKPGRDSSPSVGSQADLLREARHILQKLSEKSYPYAQYYLGDGYASGLFSKGTEDYDRAFPLFSAASKHGHAEAGYRAALCYEFGWGTRIDPQKAVQFYRQSASKNHPGAMTRLGKACLAGDLGLGSRNREGLKWLKRAAESADYQYNSAPYELGTLHEVGFGDDIFQDESYAAQLFTQSADLGHMEANYRLGDAYEHGKLGCPRDPALSVHFYTGAAQRNHALAQMALCAWYMVGAEPVLEKDENEAYEWARKAAESGE